MQLYWLVYCFYTIIKQSNASKKKKKKKKKKKEICENKHKGTLYFKKAHYKGTLYFTIFHSHNNHNLLGRKELSFILSTLIMQEIKDYHRMQLSLSNIYCTFRIIFHVLKHKLRICLQSDGIVCYWRPVSQQKPYFLTLQHANHQSSLVIIEVSGHQYQWLAGGYDLEI